MSTPFFSDMLVLLVMAGLNGRSSSEFAMEKTAGLLGLERNHIPFCEATDLHMSSLHRAGCFALALGRCHLPQGGHRAGLNSHSHGDHEKRPFLAKFGGASSSKIPRHSDFRRFPMVFLKLVQALSAQHFWNLWKFSAHRTVARG